MGMAILRWIGKTFGSMIFSTALILLILGMSLVDLTSYENVKSASAAIAKEQLFSKFTESDLNDFRTYLISQCTQSSVVNVPIGTGTPVILKCADVSNTKNNLKDMISNAVADSVYYKNFNCSFIDCLTKGGLQNAQVIFSNEGHLFLKGTINYLWILTGVGLVILLASASTWQGRLKGIGFNLVFAGLPFLFINMTDKFIPPLPEGFGSVHDVINSFIASIRTRLMIVLIAGIVLIVLGFMLGFYTNKKRNKS